MKIEQREFEVHVPMADGSGIAKKDKVMVPVMWDEDIQDWLMTPEGQEIIEEAKARLTDLLLPADFKNLRERYDFSQKEMGELFQVGEKSWTRWESGKQRPSRSINLMIRALFEGEISINYLLKKAGKPVKNELVWNEFIRLWQHVNQPQLSRMPESIFLHLKDIPIIVVNSNEATRHSKREFHPARFTSVLPNRGGRDFYYSELVSQVRESSSTKLEFETE